MRARSTRIILLTEFPELEHPGGLIVPSTPTVLQNHVRSERTIVWNMEDDSEVEGTVQIDRSVLWDVLAEDGPAPTNYIEFPFFQFLQWRADPDHPSNSYGLLFYGNVRMWESGTVQMIGRLKYEPSGGSPPISLSSLSYKVWFGETGQPGSLQTVATISTASPGTWYDVNWSGKPGAAEHCEMIYGGIPDALPAEWRAEMWKYPDGLVLPPDPPDVYGGSAGGIAVTATGLSRNSNDIDGTWAIAPGPFVTQHYIASLYYDTADADDANPRGFAYSSAVAHLNDSTLFGALGGSFSRTIPDSATVGLGIQIWNAAQNVNTGTFDIGPFLRLAYAPTIQQGIDPIP